MSDDMTIGEITRDLRNIHETLESHRQQISLVRHGSKDLAQKFDAFQTLGNYIKKVDDTRFTNFQDEVRADIKEINEKLEPIHDFVTGQKGVETYRKWLIGMVITLTGVLVAFLAFVVSTAGGTG